jgi:adenine-specific DNA-methyltransferase
MERKMKEIEIKSRRYLGNKKKLLEFIKNIISENVSEYNSFCDLFAGTGIVGDFFNKSDIKIISNDILYSNFITLSAWLESTQENINLQKIKKNIAKYNQLKNSDVNYFSKNFGGTYFSMKNAKKIGMIRDLIERDENLNLQERKILITSLIYAVDKVANTCGHYDAYRRKLDSFKDLELVIPKVKLNKNINNEVFMKDANKLIKNLKVDILYLDPPYNSRQYSDAYHLLENLSEWKKPKVYGVAKKMDRSHIKSKYNLCCAEETFEDLIKNANAKYILLSYNTTENKLNNRSNAKISTKFIIDTLKKKGKVKIYEKEFKQFTAGKTNLKNHKERIYFVEVKNAK